jgi:threonine/homoserine/homoserine lactone efflux protein
MITFSLWSALIVYYFIMFATPGPNNAMLTASGIKFGYIKTLPHLIGIPLGHFFQITLVSYGLGNVFLKFPALQFYMKILCFIYLVYLSWKMLGSFSVVKKESGRPLRFYEASLFQFINPKAWTVAITAVAGFFPLEESFFKATMFLALTAPFICFPSISLWALFGSTLRMFVNNLKTKTIIEYILALLLILTALFVLIK